MLKALHIYRALILAALAAVCLYCKFTPPPHDGVFLVMQYLLAALLGAQLGICMLKRDSIASAVWGILIGLAALCIGWWL